MSRLGDVSIGSFTRTRRDRGAARVTPSGVETAPEISSDLSTLRGVPGIQPFLDVDLIPDLIYIMQREGLESYLDQVLPVTIPDGILPPGPADPVVVENKVTRDRLLTTFRLYGMKQLLSSSPELNGEEILTLGAAALASLVEVSDPSEPESIIFEHRSQDEHRSTQKVQIELTRNEPEVQERSTIQCACGSRKIQTSQKQTRSADEAMTIFAQCVSCKANWRM